MDLNNRYWWPCPIFPNPTGRGEMCMVYDELKLDFQKISGPTLLIISGWLLVGPFGFTMGPQRAARKRAVR